MTPPSSSQFPEQGILWRGWNDETLRLTQEKGFPVPIFITDLHAFEWPLLKAVFKEMPTNARLRELLHEFCPALFLKADELPDDLTMLGAGSRYRIAVLAKAQRLNRIGSRATRLQKISQVGSRRTLPAHIRETSGAPTCANRCRRELIRPRDDLARRPARRIARGFRPRLRWSPGDGR
jgi:hypothetical protein